MPQAARPNGPLHPSLGHRPRKHAPQPSGRAESPVHPFPAKTIGWAFSPQPLARPYPWADGPGWDEAALQAFPTGRTGRWFGWPTGWSLAEGGLGGVAAAGREGVPIRGHRGVGGGGGLVFVIAEVVDAAPAAGDPAGEGGVLQREAAGRGESPGLRRRSQPHFLTKEGLPLPMGRASPTRGKQFPPRKRSADL